MTPIILAKILFHPTLLFTQLVSYTLGLGKRVESGRVLFSQPSSPGTFTGTSPSSSLLSLALNRVLCYFHWYSAPSSKLLLTGLSPSYVSSGWLNSDGCYSWSFSFIYQTVTAYLKYKKKCFLSLSKLLHFEDVVAH